MTSSSTYLFKFTKIQIKFQTKDILTQSNHNKCPIVAIRSTCCFSCFLSLQGSACVWGTRHHCYMLHVTCYVKASPTSVSASGAMAWRASSHITMPAVTLTLRECFVPNCGISRQPSHASTTSWWTPFTSLPKTSPKRVIKDI